MAFQFFNNNPSDKLVGDCVVRAVSLATDESWDKTYIALSLLGFLMKDVFSSNAVWGAYLIQNGFDRDAVSSYCPECYTIADFAAEHPKGVYVLATGTHVVTVIDGVYLDTWDSGSEIPQYFFKK